MSFKIATLKGTIGHSDEQAALFRGLVQALSDHGASRKELEELLADAKGDKRFFGLLARKVMGRIWELVEEMNFYMGPIEFDVSAEEFLKRASNGLYIHDAYRAPLLNNQWLESQPRGRCEYRLIQQSFPVYRWYLYQHPQLQDGVEYAGWRELVYYASKLEPGDLKHCRIFGLGTPLLDTRGEAVDEFFYLCEENNGVEMSANGTMNLGPSCFHLVRVYSS